MSGTQYPALTVGEGVPAPANILQLAQTAQGFQANQLALQQQRAKIAVGQAYQAATDPTTGNVDLGKFKAIVAGDPNASAGALAAGDTATAQASTQASTANTQQATLAAKAGIYGHVLQSLITKGDKVQPSDVAAAGQDMINSGMFTPDEINKELANAPNQAGPALQDYVARHQALAGQVLAQIGVTSPTAIKVSNGKTDYYTAVKPGFEGGGLTGPGTPVTQGITPSQAAGQESGIDQSTGQPYATTTGQRLAAEGQGGLVNPPPPGTTPLPPGAENYPWNKTATAPSAAPTQPPSAPGTVTTGPAPGVTGAMATQAQGGAEAAQALVNSAGDRPNRMAAINNMLQDLTTFKSGPGMDTLRRGFSVLNNYTGLGLDEGGIEGAQNFNKVAQQVANSQTAALGAGTNEKLAANMHANPNSSLQTGTNVQILHTFQGNEDAINAKANAWQQAQKQGVPPAAYNQWSQQFNQSFDPRAFQMLRMSPEERQNLQSEMAKAGTLQDFKANVNAMARAGILPTQQQNGQ